MADIQIYEVIHTSPELKTVYDYISEINSPAFNYTSDSESFLTVKNTKGQTNREVIELTYTTKAEKDAYKGKSTRQMLLKIGTRLAIEQKKVNKAGLMTEGLEIVSYDIGAFKARALAELESKEGYTVQDYAKPIKGQIQKGTFRSIYPDATVWIWCRALRSSSNNFEGEIFNVTSFVERVETDMSKNGGNFQLTLPPLICEMNNKGQWIVKKKNIQFYQGKNLSLQKSDYVAEGNMFEEKEGELIRNNFLFHSIISTNDLVWIRFETLKIEADQRITDADQLYVSKFNIPDRIYDMIGLVDINGISVQAANTDVSINITGRDLSKVFIEDGTYVFNLELTQGMLGGPGSSQESGLSKRLIADKALLYLGLYFNNTIEKVIKFVFNQLSNIKIVPDQLFEPYGDRRNTRFEEKDDAQDAKTQRAKEKAGYKKTAIDSITNLRKSNGSAFSIPVDEKKKVNEVFDETYRFLKTIRDKKVRITNGATTMGWNTLKYVNQRGVIEDIPSGTFPSYFSTELFNLTVTRRVPEDLPLVGAIDKILDMEASTTDYSGKLVKEFAPGIWSIIKLVLDKGVTNRRIIDSSLSSANGALLNYFRKICQDPFVEFYMDTYGDMYHVIVRKPPTDKSGVLGMLQAQVTTESDSLEDKVTPAVIDIEASDVLLEQLAFDDIEAISWYHLQPQANFQGTDQFSLAYLPAIFFPEYAEIWGSRPMQLVHNYLPALLKDASKNSLDIVQRQAVEDMRYVIQSTAYLPFTRKGLIKTNGDRRYKVGNLIRYKPTGEIFHIDQVKQEYAINDSSIERTSTIQVSRGMIEQLIYGIPAKTTEGETINGYISYFNIIDTTPKFDYKDITNYTEERVKVGTRVINPNQVVPPEPTLEYPVELLTNKGNQNIQELYNFPDRERNKFTKFIYEINKLGYKVNITSGVRSFSEQQALHSANPLGAATAGHSRHETKLAIDINLINMISGQVYGLNVGKTSVSDWLATGVPELGRTMGMGWGGQDFGANRDVVHFQLSSSSSSSTSSPMTEDVYEVRKIPVKDGVIDIAKLFSNFKVNKHVFDFFLRREQMNYKKITDKGVYDDSGSKTMEEVILKSTKKNKQQP